jgi:2-dehydropantoate 2-reductase
MTGMTGKQRDSDPRARDLSIRLGSSCVRVGLAMGLSLETVSGIDPAVLARVEEDPAAMKQIIEMIAAVTSTRNDEQRPSMGQDILKGRRTETDWINGLVARRGEEYGVDASLHARINAVIKRVESGELKPHPKLLDLV